MRLLTSLYRGHFFRNFMNIYFKSNANSGYYFDCEEVESIQNAFQHLQILYSKDMGYMMSLDGHIMITQKDEYQYHEMIVHPNCLLLPEYERALIIGGGDGLCARELLKYPFHQVEQVEIDKDVSFYSQKYFSEQLGQTFSNPRFHAYYQDALTFFKDNTQYDFISLDLTDPDEDYAHSNALYSTQFYQTCHNHLKEQGIMVVQVACPYLFESHFRAQVHALSQIFPHYALYGKYMRCYGTYQYFMAVSQHLDLQNIDVGFLYKKMLQLNIGELKLYRPEWHQSIIIPSQEIINILKK